MGGFHPRWTVEKIERLRELWPHMSASQIGRELGYGRNAVIGKAHRIGIATVVSKRCATRSKPLQTREEYNAKRRARRHGNGSSLSVFFPKQKKPTFAPPPEPEISEMKAPKFLGLSLMQLKNHSCRFPQGGDDGTPHRFCGQPVRAGMSYCPYHCEIAYTKQAPPRPAYAFAEPRVATKR
jgi:GcrA cell cycle regulator